LPKREHGTKHFFQARKISYNTGVERGLTVNGEEGYSLRVTYSHSSKKREGGVRPGGDRHEKEKEKN